MSYITDLMLKRKDDDMYSFITLNLFEAIDVLREDKAANFTMPDTIDVPGISGRGFNGYDAFIGEEFLPRFYECIPSESATHAYSNILAYYLLTSSNYGTKYIEERLKILDELLEI